MLIFLPSPSRQERVESLRELPLWCGAHMRPVQGFLVQPVCYHCGAGTVPLAAPDALADAPLGQMEAMGCCGEDVLTHKVCEQDDQCS